MANFTVRIELYGEASEQVYEKLHAAMKTAHYYRLIKLGDEWFHMPTAEYTASSQTMSTEEIRDEAYGIAKTVWTKPAVFVTKADGGRFTQALRSATAADIRKWLD